MDQNVGSRFFHDQQEHVCRITFPALNSPEKVSPINQILLSDIYQNYRLKPINFYLFSR